ncbi:MAG: GNAT family acetyltransferase [Eubacteriales bacterium]|nr:GNAT family acetyltransferase [Eubacteriales bacterium]
MLNDITVFNIREYLQSNDDDLGEDALREVLSEFSCEKNPDVEKFLKEQAIEFTKKNQSVTYIVLSNDAELLGYFTLAIKPITVRVSAITKTMARKVARVSELNEYDGSYLLSAFLIAQLGKNYRNDLDKRITGEQLLEAAVATIRELQFRAGGMVVFLEAVPEERLLYFYQVKNQFKLFDSRLAKGGLPEEHTLVQLLKVL